MLDHVEPLITRIIKLPYSISNSLCIQRVQCSTFHTGYFGFYYQAKSEILPVDSYLEPSRE